MVVVIVGSSTIVYTTAARYYFQLFLLVLFLHFFKKKHEPMLNTIDFPVLKDIFIFIPPPVFSGFVKDSDIFKFQHFQERPRTVSLHG